VPELGVFECTLINSGIPSVIVSAKDIDLSGVELQEAVNNRSDLLARVELIRAYGALKMGLIDSIEQAQESQHTPKILFLSSSQTYTSSSNSRIDSDTIDFVVRAFSMGKMHHAMMGTAAVALASAASVPGTLVSDLMGDAKTEISIGHPSGKLKVGACGIEKGSNWSIVKATMSRSARILMKGEVFVPLV
jgi:2-methylaconitate cis-trans-isomerase PrpF